jgi:hypothetical protein
MTRKVLFITAFVACAFMLGNVRGVSTANAAAIGNSALGAGIQASKEAAPRITEARHRRYRRYRRHRRGNVVPYVALGLFLGHALNDGPRYRRSYRGRNRCSHWARRCANNWGYRNNNFYGCLRYHGCR